MPTSDELRRYEVSGVGRPTLFYVYRGPPSNGVDLAVCTSKEAAYAAHRLLSGNAHRQEP